MYKEELWFLICLIFSNSHNLESNKAIRYNFCSQPREQIFHRQEKSVP